MQIQLRVLLAACAHHQDEGMRRPSLQLATRIDLMFFLCHVCLTMDLDVGNVHCNDRSYITTSLYINYMHSFVQQQRQKAKHLKRSA